MIDAQVSVINGIYIAELFIFKDDHKGIVYKYISM